MVQLLVGVLLQLCLSILNSWYVLKTNAELLVSISDLFPYLIGITIISRAITISEACLQKFNLLA